MDIQLGGTRKAAIVLVLLSGSPMLALCFTLISPVIPLIAIAFDGQVEDSTLFAQTVITYAATGMMVGGPIGGWLASQIGTKTVLLGSFITFLIAGTAGFWITDPFLLLSSRVLLGAAACSLQTCCFAFTGDLFSGVLRIRILSLQPAMGAIVAILSILLAGEVASAHGWQAVFILYLLGIPSLILAGFVLPSTHSVSTEEDDSANKNIGQYLKVWYIFVLMAGVSILLNMPSIQLPLKLAADGILDPAINSRVVAAFSITLSLAAIGYNEARNYLGTHGVFLFGLVILGAGYTLIGFTSAPLMTAAAAALAGIGGGLINPHFSILMIERTPEAIRTSALGFLMACFFFGEFMIPYTANPLRLAFGIDTMLQIFGGVAVVAATIGFLWIQFKPTIDTQRY